MRLRETDLDRDPMARVLIFRQWSELCERYGVPAPCGEHEAMPTGTFAAPGGVFLVGEVDGVAVACGGVRRCQEERPGVGEIKRMYVEPAMRGRGLGRVLLAALEAEGRRLGYERLWLETGIAQPEALHLYVSSGWSPIPKYGEYKHEEGSRCFERILSTRSSAEAAAS
jgi:GNAT superfamily N-acetyltransferase